MTLSGPGNGQAQVRAHTARRRPSLWQRTYDHVLNHGTSLTPLNRPSFNLTSTPQRMPAAMQAATKAFISKSSSVEMTEESSIREARTRQSKKAL